MSPVTRIKLTERRPLPVRLTVGTLCVHTRFYTFTPFKQHTLVHVAVHTENLRTHGLIKTLPPPEGDPFKKFFFLFFLLPYKAFRIKTAR